MANEVTLASDIVRSGDAASNKRRQGHRMALLVLPLLIFIGVAFLWPVAKFLTLAWDNSDISENLGRTTQALAGWDPQDGVPGEVVFGALVQDLADAKEKGRDGVLAQLINQRLAGNRFLVIKTATDANDGKFSSAPVKDALLAAHPGWANPALWSAIALERHSATDYYLLATLDLMRAPDGAIGAVPPERAAYLDVLFRTIWISLVVTALCVVLAVPLAQAIVSAPPGVSRLLFALVLFPLWTSLLIRTVIWIIVLQKNGPVNASLVFLGFIEQPLSLIYTRFSLYITMVQVLLPMMVLSIVSVMRRVPQTYMKAALSLGAPWIVAWWRVQLPLILPGIWAGSAIVFVFSLGFYITPTLVGGPSEQMISSYIAFFTNTTLNWGMAAALSVQLLLILVFGAFLVWSTRIIVGRVRS